LKLAEVLAMAVVLAVVVVGWQVTMSAQRAADRASDWEVVAGGMQADMAVGHVWLEEHLANDPTVDVERDVLGSLRSADLRCRLLRDGGRSADVGRVAPVDPPALRRDVVGACSRIARLAEMTDRRLSAPTSRPGTALDAVYDVQFRRTLSLARRLPGRITVVRDGAERRVTHIQVAAIVLLSAALLLAAWLIRRSERRLRRVVREREAILESAGEGILAIDRDGTIAFANAAAAVLLGRRPRDLAGLFVGALLDDDATRDYGHGTLPGWLDPGPGLRTAELRRSDGTVFPIEYTATAPGGRAARGVVVLSFRDITARQRREDERDAELSELRAIRETLVPEEVPERPGVDLATCFVAAERGVAGDFYLVAEGPGDTTVIAVGDVAGKGVVAARRAAFVRATLASFASYSDSPAQLLELTNRALLGRSIDSGLLTTAVCVVIDHERQLLRWALAGHPPPLRLDAGTPMPAPLGLPLGLQADLGAVDAVAPYQDGSGFLLYTDGLTDARAPETAGGSPRRFGSGRVGAIVGSLEEATPRAVVHELRAAAEAFSEGALCDDLCIVAVRHRAAARAAARVRSA
jgi:PAS domain S-box-containing protein